MGHPTAWVSTLRAQGWEENEVLLGGEQVFTPRLALGVQVQRNGWEAGRLGRNHWVGNIGVLYEAGWITKQAYVRFSGVWANIGSGLSSKGRRTGQRPRSVTLGMQVVGRGRVGSIDCRWEDDRWGRCAPDMSPNCAMGSWLGWERGCIWQTPLIAPVMLVWDTNGETCDSTMHFSVFRFRQFWCAAPFRYWLRLVVFDS